MRIVSLDHLVLTVRIFCATANPTEVVLAETETGRGILGVVDGFKGRKDFLRQIGYKL
jgi:adenosine/AMP kinase